MVDEHDHIVLDIPTERFGLRHLRLCLCSRQDDEDEGDEHERNEGGSVPSRRGHGDA